MRYNRFFRISEVQRNAVSILYRKIIKQIITLSKDNLDNLTGDDIGTVERKANVLLNGCKDIGLAVNVRKTMVVRNGEEHLRWYYFN